MKVVLVVPVRAGAMEKALNTSRLVKKEVEVHRNGAVFKQMRWLRPDEAPAGKRQAKQEAPAQPRPAAPVEPQRPRIPRGQAISFTAGGAAMQGTVIDDSHAEGVVVKTDKGEKFNVRWQDIAQGGNGGNDGNAAPAAREGKQDATADDPAKLAGWLVDANAKDNRKTIDKAKLVQPTGDIDALYKLAEEARDGFRQFMEKAKDELGAKKLLSRPVLKDKARVKEKMKEDGAADARQIYDIDGHTLVFDDLAGVARGLKYFMAQGAALRIKNNYATPSPAGYRDININIQLPNGMISEVQINTEAMMEAKESAGHVFYEVMREITASPPAPPPPEPFEDVASAQKSLYSFAWELSRGSRTEANLKASLFEIARPFWKKSAYILESRGSSWLSDKTRKHFQDFGSKAYGVSSSSKNFMPSEASPSLAKSLWRILFPPRSQYTRGS